MSLCIESLVLEPGCSLLGREDILGYFVEFQLLNYNCGDLETPSVMVPPPQPITTLRFNFRKGGLVVHSCFMLQCHFYTCVAIYVS